MACGTNDITGEWTGRIGSSVSVITVRPTGCHVVLTLTGASCTETIESDVTVGATAGTWTETTGGITSCAPVGCLFDPADDPCKVGDHAQSRLQAVTSTADGFVTSSIVPDGVCKPYGLPVVATWTRSP